MKKLMIAFLAAISVASIQAYTITVVNELTPPKILEINFDWFTKTAPPGTVVFEGMSQPITQFRVKVPMSVNEGPVVEETVQVPSHLIGQDIMVTVDKNWLGNINISVKKP